MVGTAKVGALRSDALRNRDALIEAAHEVFRRRGLDAPLDEIARHAGIGNATLYRHFPTRASLVSAVFVGTLERLVEACRRALDNPDPWAGFADYVLAVCQLQAEDRGVADLLTVSIPDDPTLRELRSRLHDDFARVAERAKRSGTLRADFRPEDMVVLLMANAGLVHRTSRRAPTAWRRLVNYVLDGLRTEAALAPAPPAPSEASLRAALTDAAAHFGCG